MKVVMHCLCGFEWSASHGARQVTVSLVNPRYVPPCPKCGKEQQQVIITQEDGDIGVLEITSSGGSGTSTLM